MKIGVDVSPIVYGTGVSVYIKNLVENLLQIDNKNDYILFFSSLRQNIGDWRQEIRNKGAKIKSSKIPPTLLDILWNKFHIVPIETFVGKVDVFHCSDWTQPPSKRAKLVTTIHDLSFLRWPETAHPKVLAAQKRRLKWVEKEADAVIAVSQATKDEIVELTDIPEDKITVIYEAIPADAEIFASRYSKLTPSVRDIKKPYILASGSQAPRKNIKKLLKAFSIVRLSNGSIVKNTKLVITGRYELQEKLPKGVITTGFLEREDLLALMNQAEAFVYPSLYEGFGLPILEAFALETPVVTSNCSSMKEIAGNAAVLVEPKAVESIAEGIKKVLEDKDLQKKLIKMGKNRLDDFSWEKTASQTLEVYKQVFNLG